MRYQISGKQIDVGEALQTHVRTELDEVVEKYAQRPTDALIIFSRDAHEYVCEATIHLSTGMRATAKAAGTEIYGAFDKCRDRMEKQLRRYKRRLKDHHRARAEPIRYDEAPSYILSTGADETDAEPESLQPVVIAEMETRVPTLSAGEAVMQMELAETAVLVFRNERHGGVNVVYRRDDGNIGWIDPANSG